MILENKKVVIMGVRNKWSIAFGIAKSAYENGAQLLFTYMGEENKEKIEEISNITIPSPANNITKASTLCFVARDKMLANDQVYNCYNINPMYIRKSQAEEQYEEKQKIETTNKVIYMKQAQSKKEMKLMKENEKKIILMRHDMRHFLNNILNDLKNNQNEHAIEYIHTLFDAIDQTVRKKYCLNDTVNMIMTSYENRMKDENIDFHYHLDIPQQLSISDIDLTSILSNGLENAFKAVMLLENERFIELNMQEKCGKLLISIENNYLNEPIFVDGIPISKEKDHGFGTQSIAYTVEKLHGNCQFSTHQHHFKLRVVI